MFRELQSIFLSGVETDADFEACKFIYVNYDKAKNKTQAWQSVKVTKLQLLNFEQRRNKTPTFPANFVTAKAAPLRFMSTMNPERVGSTYL